MSSPFPYPGGKGEQSEWIINRIPPHKCFIEVFGGSGAITYNKKPSQYEIYNDLDDDLVQFYRVLRENPEKLINWLRAVPYSRTLYRKWVEAYYDGYRPDDPIARAGRFFSLRYMQTQGEASKPNGMKTRAKRSPARSFDNGREMLSDVAERFKQVTIENKDAITLLQDYDDPDIDVVFYCDWPYPNTEHYYGRDFSHPKFVQALDNLDSEWMVSSDTLPTWDTNELPQPMQDDIPPEIADIGHVIERNRRHRMRKSDKDKTEYLICSFDPETTPSFVDNSTTQQRLI